ncbi:MAG: DUF378 domain-containing protein [Cyanobacteria bacterium SIG28]|nr:DUF378 domain-containing protein [Cyanobacteria bacterium SIG28]
MKFLKNTAYILVLIGALNWGLIGIFGYNLVGSLFGDMTLVSRIIYSLVGISAIITAFAMHQCNVAERDENCEYGRCSF